MICKPFKNHHTEQLRLVQAFDWLDLSTLDDVEQMMGSIFAQDMTGAYVDAGRASAVARSVRRRIERLASIVTQRRSEPLANGMLSTEDDVEKNVAADYASGKGTERKMYD